MNHDEKNFSGGKQMIAGGLAAFAVGGIGLIWGFVTNPKYARYAYLSAYAWVLSMVLGALIFLMIAHTMDAKWPVAIRRVVEAIVGILPLGVIGFLPIALGVGSIYPWAFSAADRDPEMHELATHQRAYLNPSSFFLRAIVYFAIWVAVAGALRYWSLRQDDVPDVRQRLYSRIVSAIGLFPVGISLTFASFDWLMSLSPMWYSTLFGVYWFAGGFGAAMALIVILVASLQRTGQLEGITRAHYYALGRLLLTFTIFWAYAAYFQVFLIWMADKPHEVLFYSMRSTKEWFPFSVALAIVHFAIPFFVLLFYRVKQGPATLVPIAVWVLVAHWMDMEWLVMPVLRPVGPAFHWLDPAALICVGGAAVAYGAFRLRKICLVPKNDPALEAARRYESA